MTLESMPPPANTVRAMPEPLTVNGVHRRLLAASGIVVAVILATFSLMVLLVSNSAERGSTLGFGLVGCAIALGGLGVYTLALRPAIRRAIEAHTRAEPLDEEVRNTLYSAPRKAALSLVWLSGAALVVGYLPLDPAGASDRALAGNLGCVCAGFGMLVLYVSARIALRPVLESIRLDQEHGSVLEAQERFDPAAVERLDWRIALAVAVPSTAAAMLAASVVLVHMNSIAADEEATAYEQYEQALRAMPQRVSTPSQTTDREGPALATPAVARTVETQTIDEPSGVVEAIAVLRTEGIAVNHGDKQPEVVRVSSGIAYWLLWMAPLAVVVAAIAVRVGRRMGKSVSADIERAAVRLRSVDTKDIRSVTMSMVNLNTAPEIREMALALDLLAGALLRMSDDEQKALRSRTEASRLRSFVLASVSHDLRAPLNSVLGFAELLLSGAEGPLTDGHRESLEALTRGGRDLLRLVDDLLDHARLDAGRMPLDKKRASADAVVERARMLAIERTRGRVPDNAVSIEGEAGLSVLADEDRLGDALGSLAAFAMLRPGSDGRAVIRVGQDQENVRFTIRGGGTTPPKEGLTRMFDPFDFAPAGARAPAGLNLAVSIARGLIGLHDNPIEATPNEEGGGILLSVALPRLASPSSIPPSSTSGIVRTEVS